jgi:hypothetical protein
MTAGTLLRSLLVAASIAAFAAVAQALTLQPGFTPIAVTARPITDFLVGEKQTRFGALEFRGGLDLDSPAPDFGSLSGLDFAADGRTIYAISDNGFWFRARIVEDNGRLVGIEDAAMAPILDSGGVPLAGKQNSDAEGLRVVTRNGRETAFISFEQVANVASFVASPDLAMARRRTIRLPAFVNNIRRNQGLEAIAIAPQNSAFAGAIVVIAERSLNAAGNHRGFILNGPLKGTFAVRRIGTFDVTDAAFLPDGDLIVLERHFALSDGLGFRIRRIPAATIRPDATVDGPILIQSAEFEQFDNMEGLALRTGPSGETLLTLISDDNHSLLQRTLLLQFAIVPGAVATTSPPG